VELEEWWAASEASEQWEEWEAFPHHHRRRRHYSVRQ
jgi:hypothetical protein